MSAHKPATPLPWVSFPPYGDNKTIYRVSNTVDNPNIGEVCVLYAQETNADAAYIAHTANAYPGLIELIQEVDDLLPRISDDDPMAPALRDWLRKVRSTMRELGEDA